MIFIFSEDTDIFTDKVCAELSHSKVKYHRFDDKIGIKDFTYKNTSKNNNVITFNNLQPETIWHRRGRFNIIPNVKLSYLKREADSVLKSTELNLKRNIRYLGSYLKEVENYKITQLEYAKACHLKIPDTLITTSKKSLVKFYKTYAQCITKDIRYPANLEINSYMYASTGVKVLDNKMLDMLDVNFAPILVQEFVNKEYEIRLFFFENNFYPMAIFSQKNSNTQVDFRNHDKENPNRFVPVILPNDLLVKIKHFIKMYGINTGSIDLIYSKNEEYIFLEINPQGQLNWLSENCNYYIEKELSNYLTNKA